MPSGRCLSVSGVFIRSGTGRARILEGHPFTLRATALQEANITGKIYHPESKHPGEYQQDLNPDATKGQNYGLAGSHPEKRHPRTAHDIKEIHRRLHDLTDDLLKQIPVLPEGSRLEQGATYIDLKDPARREFTATGDMVAGPSNWYVPKSEVDYQLWNRLIGVTNPERTGEGNAP